MPNKLHVAIKRGKGHCTVNSSHLISFDVHVDVFYLYIHIYIYIYRYYILKKQIERHSNLMLLVVFFHVL